MPAPKLIVITGLPATGKTSLAKEISKSLSVPLLTKDEIKIGLLEQFGKKDRAWDRQVGTAAVHLLMKIGEALLISKSAVILESNFKEEFDAPLLRDLMEKTNSDCLQLVCGADGEVLLSRFIEREKSSARSPFHFTTSIDEFSSTLELGFEEPMRLPGDLITVDTTDFKKVDLRGILARLKVFLES
jgi:predicted kinase